MKPGIQKLIFEYFNCNIFDDYEIYPSIKNNIVETFTFAYNHHKAIKELNIELEGSNIEKLKETIKSYNNPFPVRLGQFKPKLQQDAFNIERGTIHGVIRQIIADYYLNKEKNEPILKLIELSRIKRHNIKNHIYQKKYGRKAKYSPTLF